MEGWAASAGAQNCNRLHNIGPSCLNEKEKSVGGGEEQGEMVFYRGAWLHTPGTLSLVPPPTTYILVISTPENHRSPSLKSTSASYGLFQ